MLLAPAFLLELGGEQLIQGMKYGMPAPGATPFSYYLFVFQQILPQFLIVLGLAYYLGTVLLSLGAAAYYRSIEEAK